MGIIYKNGEPYSGGGSGTTQLAQHVGYDNSTSGLSATDVQDAIDEIAAEKANKADVLDSLEEITANTEDGRIAGANAAAKLNENLENLMTYSTEEHIVGKWIDGKDLYEVTLVFDPSPAVTSSSGAVKDSHDISSLGKMSMAFVESAFFIRQGSQGTRNAYYQLPFKNADNKGIWVSPVRLEKQTIDVTADDENFKYGGAVYVTLRYTKE